MEWSPLLKFLKGKSLRIKGSGITHAHIALLAKLFPNVQVLELSNIGITTQEIQALSLHEIFVSLKELNLSSNPDINDEAIDSLSRAPFVRQPGLFILSESSV